ncbi:MAG: hypothetical protein IMHGJWDQ_002010 [Candidatus Fervidibacter sp.]
MRLACSTRCFEKAFQRGEMSINTFFAASALLGVDGVEIFAEHLPSTRATYATTLRERLQEHELVLATISCQVPEPKELTEVVEPLMSFAKELRARSVCLVGAFEWHSYRDPLAQLMPAAERLALPIGLAMPLREKVSSELSELLDDIASPYLGICLTISAEISPQDPLWQNLVAMAPFALHVHLLVSDLGRSLTWLPALELLREVEYEGFLSFVQVPEPTEDNLRLLCSQLASLMER